LTMLASFVVKVSNEVGNLIERHGNT